MYWWGIKSVETSIQAIYVGIETHLFTLTGDYDASTEYKCEKWTLHTFITSEVFCGLQHNSHNYSNEVYDDQLYCGMNYEVSFYDNIWIKTDIDSDGFLYLYSINTPIFNGSRDFLKFQQYCKSHWICIPAYAIEQ
jgi:hypothetical protein